MTQKNDGGDVAMTDRVKWPVGGYAPGGYAGCKCNICGEYFIAAKRAYTCADCTIQSLLAERDRLREALQKCADPHRYHAPCIHCCQTITECGSYIARAALKGDQT